MQSIVNPIEALKRSGRETIGFHGSERHDQDLYTTERQRSHIDSSTPRTLVALQCEYEEADDRCEAAEKRERRLCELVRILDC